MIEKTLNLVENVSTSQAYTVPENDITHTSGWMYGVMENTQ